jgi:pyridoxamine 5'-phosphate oxidase
MGVKRRYTELAMWMVIQSTLGRRNDGAARRKPRRHGLAWLMRRLVPGNAQPDRAHGGGMAVAMRHFYTARMKPLADLRKDYSRAELDEAHADADPLKLFERWLHEAVQAQLPEPNAMTLATVGADGRPSTRIVLIKGFDARGIVWYTNYASRKGTELAAHPFAALQFHWVELERVVRLEGLVEKVSAEESDAYFASRPLASRIGAWASPQSEAIDSRGLLLKRAAEYGLKFALSPPRPPHWGGYRLAPQTWEFWQGRPSRLHDRLRYRLQPSSGWQRQRLAP